MKKVVSFETAKRLKESGYPQPEVVNIGEFYYNDFGTGRFCGQSNFDLFDNDKIIFAPDSTDILSELGEDIYLSCTPFVTRPDEYACFQTDRNGYLERISNWNENSAEACAEVWLKK